MNIFRSALALAGARAGSAGFTTMVSYWLVDLRELLQDARKTTRQKQTAILSRENGKQEWYLYINV
jgi:hypothetical protein